MESMIDTISTLTETTFQKFLENNLKRIFVFETADYDYKYYLPAYITITSNSRGVGIFSRQA
jgi:hypothetical protein